MIGPAVSEPPEAVVKKRFVVDAVVAKKLVEVLFEVVELTPVKFCRVDEPVTRRFDAERVPERVSFPPREVVKNKFVVDAIPANNEEVVAFVEVEFNAVKF